MHYKTKIYSLYYKDKNSFFLLKEFVQFLKEYNVLEKFIKGVHNPNFLMKNTVYESIYKQENSLFNGILTLKSSSYGFYGRQLINFAFYWMRTSDGYDFWASINEIWRERFNEKFHKQFLKEIERNGQ